MPHFGKKRVKKSGGAPATEQERAAFIKQVRASIAAKDAEYRRRSLEIHPWVCAKCGRAFDGQSIHLLTVHHRDGNHNNNPPDGSNWENLCVYCHEDEHARGVLADYVADADDTGDDDGPAEAKPSGGFGTLAAALSKLKDKEKK